MDTDAKKVTVDGVEVPFTKTEYEILKFFLENRGKVFSRDQLLSAVWPDDVIVLPRTVDVNVTRIRKKIGPYGEALVAKAGFGYSFFLVSPFCISDSFFQPSVAEKDIIQRLKVMTTSAF